MPKDNGIISEKNIKTAFRNSSKEQHGDVGAQNKSEKEITAAKENMQRVTQARDVLMQRFG